MKVKRYFSQDVRAGFGENQNLDSGFSIAPASPTIKLSKNIQSIA
jgi:hypothetical protein